VPQGTVHVVERLGRFSGLRHPGFYLAVPFIDKISYVIDHRETTLRIQPAMCVTQDNVSVTLDGVVFLQIVDPYKAAYGALHPLLAVVQHAQSVMRTAIGQRTLDEAFHDRVKLNADIREGIESSAANWGVVVLRYEVLEIQPDVAVAKAMDLQATAERRRREKVTTAEADKRAAVLQAEGLAEATERAAAADKRATVMEAEGAAEAVHLRAAAAKAAAMLEAEGQAAALVSVASALRENGGTHAAGLGLAESYIDMMGEGMSRSNTMMMMGGGGGSGKGGAAGVALDGFDEALARAVVLAGTASNALAGAVPGPEKAATQAAKAARQGPTQSSSGFSDGENEAVIESAAAASRPARTGGALYELYQAPGREDDSIDRELDLVLEGARKSVDDAVNAKHAAIREWTNARA